MKTGYNVSQSIKRQIQQSAINLIDSQTSHNKPTSMHNASAILECNLDQTILEEHIDSNISKEQLIAKYRNKIKKLKYDNIQLMQMIQQSDMVITQKIIDEKNEQEQVLFFQKTIINQLTKLNVINEYKIDECKSFKELLITLDNMISKCTKAINFPPIESSNPNHNLDVSSLKHENDLLRSSIAKIENQNNHIEREFKNYILEGYRMNGELKELKALKKSIQQYYTSQNCQSWKSTAVADFTKLGGNSSNGREIEEPSPSFLRIMVAEQIIEEDISKTSSPNLQSCNFSPVDYLKMPINKTPSPTKQVPFLNQNLKVNMFENSNQMKKEHSMEQSSFSLPDIQSNFGETPHRNSSYQRLQYFLNGKLQNIQGQHQNQQQFNIKYQNMTLQQLLAKDNKLANRGNVSLSERIMKHNNLHNNYD